MDLIIRILNIPIILFDRLINFLSHHIKVYISIMGILYLALSISLSLKDYPIPYVHDEFAYLLGADTFSKCRITNPTHPMWEHFETFHVIQKPTYQSKYPPASSLFMSIGFLTTGHAIAGVWLAGCLAVMTICWMLTLYMPARWAVFGGFIVAMHPTITCIWSQNYWGGSVALLGGALLIGGAKKLVKRWDYSGGLIMGMGALILFHSRPFEGGLLFVVFSGMLILNSWRVYILRIDKMRIVKAVVLVMIILIITLISLALYNNALTGNALTFPHRLWKAAYQNNNISNPRIARYQGSNPLSFIMRSERVIAFFIGFWIALPFMILQWPSERPILRRLIYALFFIIILGFAFPQMNLRPYAMIGLLLVFQSMLMVQSSRKTEAKFLAGTLLFVVFIGLAYTRGWPHYFAPVAPILFILISLAVRHISKGKLLGFIPGKIIMPLLLSAIIWNAVTAVHGHPKLEPSRWDKLSVYVTPSWSRDRILLMDHLKKIAGKHLIIVHYPESYNIHCEWVYNKADIDNERIVWAHDLGPEKNIELISYFSDRHIWLFNPGDYSLVEYKR